MAERDRPGAARAALLGTGHAVPGTIRRNDAPIFDWLHRHPPTNEDLFAGYDERRVLAPGECIEDLAVTAAQRALSDADVAAGDIDILLGYISTPEYLDPNSLALVHQRLRLPPRALVVPINNEFNNFNSAYLLADALLRTRGAARALIVCAGNWTRAVDYHTAQSVSAGDGAGAVVLGPRTAPAQFVLLDHETVVDSVAYASMYLAGAPVQRGSDCDAVPQQCTYTRPFFQITPAGAGYFRTFGTKTPAGAVERLLARNGLAGSDITLISHQASSVLMDAWARAIRPAAYLSTLETFGNMTLATIPATLAHGYDGITTRYLVLLGIGVEMQTLVLLLARDQPE